MAHFPGHQSEKQRRAALEGAGLSASERGAVQAGIVAPPETTTTQNVPVDNNAITSTNLQSTQSVDIQDAPQPPEVFPIGALEISTPPLQETAPEAKAQGLTEEIAALQSQLFGEEGVSATTAEAEEEQQVTEKTQTVRDLEARFNAIRRESLAIPLQLQQEAEGRGITEGGLRPLQTARLRENAIQALGTASLLEAAQGNLTTALDLADRAVAQEFDPIREQIAVKQANLQLLLDSPDFTRAEKNRAQAQLDAQNNQLLALEDAQQRKQQLGQMLIQAALNQADSSTLEQAKRTGDPLLAAQILAPFLQQQEDALLSVAEAKSLGVPFGTTRSQAFGRTSVGPTGLAGLTPAQQTAAFKISDDFESASKDFFKVRDAYNRVLASAANPSAAGDLALIFNFMKTLDPGSVVRESEFATAAAAGSFLDRTYGFGLKLKEGQRLSPNQRQDFVDRAGALFGTAQTQEQSIVDTFTQRANAFGIPPSFVIRDIDASGSAVVSDAQADNILNNITNPSASATTQTSTTATTDEPSILNRITSFFGF